MKIRDILTPQSTNCNVPGRSKKRVLENLSHLIADQTTGMDADQLYQSFLYRERLGSTGIGSGIAIPHCRLAGCPKVMGAFLTLADPVDFDAVDGDPVDLVFALVVPEEQHEEHLAVLAAVAALLQDETKRNQLRDTATDQSLFDLITEDVNAPGGD